MRSHVAGPSFEFWISRRRVRTIITAIVCCSIGISTALAYSDVDVDVDISIDGPRKRTTRNKAPEPPPTQAHRRSPTSGLYYHHIDPPTTPPSSCENPSHPRCEVCTCHDTDSSSSYSRSDDNRGARMAYLVSIHNDRTARDAIHLLRAIRGPDTIILLHVDVKFDLEEVSEGMEVLSYEAEHCDCGSHISYMEERFDCVWGSWSMNLPTHAALATLVQMASTINSSDDYAWDVFVNLSGDSLPTLTPAAISQLFAEAGPLHNLNFVTSSACETGFLPTSVLKFPPQWHKRTAYTTRPKGLPTIHYVDEYGVQQSEVITAHFGSQWMSLTYKFCEHLVKEMARKDSLASRYKNYLVTTGRLMSDETFIPTILMHTQIYNETLPPATLQVASSSDTKQPPHKFIAIRYERMDEHHPTGITHSYPKYQRYDVPESSYADEPRVWGPYFLGVYDLRSIKASGALWIRKVSMEVDHNLVELLPVETWEELVDIGWPKEVRVSEVPDWERTKLGLMKQAARKQRLKRQRDEEDASDANDEDYQYDDYVFEEDEEQEEQHDEEL